MQKLLEVFADISCPFTHVGLAKVADEVDKLDIAVEIVKIGRAHV